MLPATHGEDDAVELPPVVPAVELVLPAVLPVFVLLDVDGADEAVEPDCDGVELVDGVELLLPAMLPEDVPLVVLLDVDGDELVELDCGVELPDGAELALAELP